MTNSKLIHPKRILSSEAVYLAPDGPEIRLQPTMNEGGLCQCTLPVGKTLSPVAHRHAEGIWYVLDGECEVWRKHAGKERA